MKGNTNANTSLVEVLVRRTAIVSLVIALAAGPNTASSEDNSTRTKSPDKHFVAVVAPVRNPTLHVSTESTVSIFSADGSLLGKHDFSSRFGDQGYFVDGIKWTPDSQYCVFRIRSSGGDSPMYAPIVVWNRKAKRFYTLKNYTADIVFSVAAPDKVQVSTWPQMDAATVSLNTMKGSEFSELR